MSVGVPPAALVGRVIRFLAAFLHRLGSIDVSDLPSLWLSSWYRDFERNIRARGLTDSQHLLALAIDVNGDQGELEIFRQRALAVGLHAFLSEGHLHVQLLPAGHARRLGLFSD